MRPWKTIAGVFVLLTIAVWGYFPFARGVRMAGDDINFLVAAWHQEHLPLWKEFLAKYPVDGWTRALALWPFIVAHHMRSPGVFLQLFYAAVWLLNGLAIARLARVLGGGTLTPFLAGCFMLTATSDWQTLVVVYAPHLLGIALYFFGVADLIVSLDESRRLIVLRGYVLLLASFFTVEYTYATVPAVLALLWFRRQRDSSGRAWRSAAILTWAILPPLVVLTRHLAQPGHAATVTAGVYDTGWLVMVARHFAHNLEPWRWAFRAIPRWFDNYAQSIPFAVFLSFAGGATFLVVWHFLREVRFGVKAIPGALGLVSIACLAALAANAGTAHIGGEFFVRSHFVSRGWVSLALAIFLAQYTGNQVGRIASGAVLALYVFCGVWGGIERQSYYRAYALYEKRELRSLLQAVPSVPADTHLLVIQPPGSPSIMAVNNPNVLPYFYGDESVRSRVIVAPNCWDAYSTVRSTPDGFIEITVNSKTQQRVPHGRIEIVWFDLEQHRFQRLSAVPHEWAAASGGYPIGGSITRSPQSVPDFVREFLAREPEDRELPPRIPR